MLRTLDDLLGLRAELRAALAVSAGPAPVSAAALFPGSVSPARVSPGSVSSGCPSPGTGPAGTGSRSAGSPGSAADAARPRVVVVGAGFVGCEVACTALALGCEVTVVEPAGPPLLRVLGEQAARAVQRAHERAGITFVTGQAVTGYTGTDRVTGVVIAPVPDGAPAPRDARAPGGAPIPSGLAPGGSAAASPAPGGSAPSVPIPSGLAPGGLAPGGSAAGSPAPGGPASGSPVPANRVLPADLVVEAIGSVPNTEWLAGTGLDLADGVLCDNSLAAVALPPVTGGQPGPLVVAVGDIARFPNPLFDNVPRRVEHWSMPTETARRAAATLHARLEGNAVDPRPFRPLPYFWSDQGELRLQSFGTLELADDVELTEGDPDRPEGGLLATYRRAGRLVGSLAVNLPPARYRELREALLAAADS
ncbi:MAG TPA: FAD-dependent oxidoreductase [Trebonia sp.]|nr:FAD-dependent oxidoreductase [Trebonia sp.]